VFIDLTDDQKELRAELRDYFRNCLDDEQRGKIAYDPFGTTYMEHCKRLGRDGMLGVAWPQEYGGRGFGPMEQQISPTRSPAPRCRIRSSR
jgi:Acyl-CoA dehydrogenases